MRRIAGSCCAPEVSPRPPPVIRPRTPQAAPVAQDADSTTIGLRPSGAVGEQDEWRDILILLNAHHGDVASQLPYGTWRVVFETAAPRAKRSLDGRDDALTPRRLAVPAAA